jgi:hypothetical protein
MLNRTWGAVGSCVVSSIRGVGGEVIQMTVRRVLGMLLP